MPQSLTQKSVGQYDLQHRLGKFPETSRVRYAINNTTNEAVAIKYFDKEALRRDNTSDQFKRDIFLLKQIRNKYVIDIKDMFANTTKLFVVMSLAEGGLLSDLIEEARQSQQLNPSDDGNTLFSYCFSEPRARYYLRQLIDGVQFCHTNGLYLGDIRPNTLLLDCKKNLKIAVAKVFGSPAGNDSSSLAYVAPELLVSTSKPTSALAQHRPSLPHSPQQQLQQPSVAIMSPAMDVWSIGVVLYELVSGVVPFPVPVASPTPTAVAEDESSSIASTAAVVAAANRRQQLHQLIKSFTKHSHAKFLQESVPSYMSSELIEMLVSFLTFDPDRRMTLDNSWDLNWMRSHAVELPEIPSVYHSFMTNDSNAFAPHVQDKIEAHTGIPSEMYATHFNLLDGVRSTTPPPSDAPTSRSRLSSGSFGAAGGMSSEDEAAIQNLLKQDYEYDYTKHRGGALPPFDSRVPRLDLSEFGGQSGAPLASNGQYTSFYHGWDGGTPKVVNSDSSSRPLSCRKASNGIPTPPSFTPPQRLSPAGSHQQQQPLLQYPLSYSPSSGQTKTIPSRSDSPSNSSRDGFGNPGIGMILSTPRSDVDGQINEAVTPSTPSAGIAEKYAPTQSSRSEKNLLDNSPGSTRRPPPPSYEQARVHSSRKLFPDGMGNSNDTNHAVLFRSSDDELNRAETFSSTSVAAPLSSSSDEVYLANSRSSDSDIYIPRPAKPVRTVTADPALRPKRVSRVLGSKSTSGKDNKTDKKQQHAKAALEQHDDHTKKGECVIA